MKTQNKNLASFLEQVKQRNDAIKERRKEEIKDLYFKQSMAALGVFVIHPHTLNKFNCKEVYK